MRAGVPGERRGAQPGGAEPPGLQPLHRHAVLLERLPVQGPAVQLVRLQQARPRRTAHADAVRRGRHVARREPAARDAEDAEEPGRDGADARRDGEVHLLRAAASSAASTGRRSPRPKWRRAAARSRSTRASSPTARASAYRKPKDPLAAGYDLDAQGRVIVPDGVIVTACQAACPTQAITFGNVLDPTSRCRS